MGKAKQKAVVEDKDKREKFGDRPTYFKFKKGANFIRIMPPPEDFEVPWVRVRRHFSLGPSQTGFSPCTETGKDCYICKQNKIKLQSQNKKERALAERRRQSIGYLFQMLDVTPLYSKKEGKNKWVADNPPPKCWGQIKVDDEGDPIGKCQRCSWNESCSPKLQVCVMSGQRIDDIADFFSEDVDITSLKNGWNIKVTKKVKGTGLSATSYTIDSSEELAWPIPKEIKEVIEKEFKDIREFAKPATAEETETAYKGESAESDLPECFGEFEKKNKKKCASCEYADLCSEESDVDADIEEDEEEEKPKKKNKVKPKKSKKKVEEDEEEDEEEEDEEEGVDEDEDEDVDEDEEEEEDEEVEEEDEGEGALLSSMDRDELKDFIKSNDLSIKVTKSMSDKDIRSEIMKQLGDEDEEDEEDEEEDRGREIKEKLKAKAKKKSKN